MLTASMEDLPLERSDKCVASEDSTQFNYHVSFLRRCAVALVISVAVMGKSLANSSEHGVQRVNWTSDQVDDTRSAWLAQALRSESFQLSCLLARFDLASCP